MVSQFALQLKPIILLYPTMLRKEANGLRAFNSKKQERDPTVLDSMYAYGYADCSVINERTVLHLRSTPTRVVLN
jgi:hypothetical protein